MRVRFGDGTLDTHSRGRLREGRPVHLTGTEFRLLEVLVRNGPKAVTKDGAPAERGTVRPLYDIVPEELDETDNSPVEVLRASDIPLGRWSTEKPGKYVVRNSSIVACTSAYSPSPDA